MSKVYIYTDPFALGKHFTHHMDAMTREQLFNKAEIARELAGRDKRIEELEEERDRYKAALQKIARYDEETNADLELCRRQWRGCVAIARIELEKSDEQV